jgi:hypothetical protein
MFVQLEDSDHALEEVRKMWHYSKANPQAAFYFLLATSPRKMKKFVLQIFTFIKTLRRHIS